MDGEFSVSVPSIFEVGEEGGEFLLEYCVGLLVLGRVLSRLGFEK
jgi:hypothetical protein